MLKLTSYLKKKLTTTKLCVYALKQVHKVKSQIKLQTLAMKLFDLHLEFRRLVFAAIALYSVVLAPIPFVLAQPQAQTTPAIPTQAKQWADQAFKFYEQDKVANAVRLYQKAANAGDLSSAYNLAVIRLTDENKLVPLNQAISHLRKAAQGNYGLAQHMLGSLYEQGKFVERSQTSAFEWFSKAAKNKVSLAYSDLATQYYLGRGTAQNFTQAAFWYEQSADAGDSSAQYILASMYETGLGVTKELSNALTWYTAAARQGDQAADAKAKEIVKRMASEAK